MTTTTNLETRVMNRMIDAHQPHAFFMHEWLAKEMLVSDETMWECLASLAKQGKVELHDFESTVQPGRWFRNARPR